jgi:beta-lactamase regulating signal transducer with metallopeptidase domain
MTTGMTIVLPPGLSGMLAGIAVRGAIILAAAFLADWLIRPRSAALRHLMWTVALAGVMILPVLRAAVPRLRVAVPLPGFAARVLERGSASAPVLGLLPGAPAPVRDFPVSGSPAANERRALPEPGSAPRASENLPGAIVAGTPWRYAIAPPAESSGIGTSGGDLLVLVWLLGMAIAAAPLFYGLWQLARIERSAPPIIDTRVLEWARLARNEMGVRRTVRLIEGPAGAMPATWGIHRPVVLLPASATGWSDDRLLAVLRHEFAHVARHDAWTQLVGELSVVAHWFNPMVWRAAVRQRIEREFACDDRVLGCGPHACDYADTLVDLARFSRASRSAALAGLAVARSSGLRDRLIALLDEDRNRDRVSRSLVWRIASFSAIPVLLLACVAPVRTTQASRGVPVASTAISPAVPPAGMPVEPVAAVLPTPPAPGSRPVAIPDRLHAAPVPDRLHAAPVPDRLHAEPVLDSWPAPLPDRPRVSPAPDAWPAPPAPSTGEPSPIPDARPSRQVPPTLPTAPVPEVRVSAPHTATASRQWPGGSLTARLLRQARAHSISDHDMTSVLRAATDVGLEGAADREAFLEAAAGIRSDAQKRLSLEGLLQGTPASADVLLAIRVSATMRSDGERVPLLQSLVPAIPPDGELHDAFLAAVAGIRSKSARERIEAATARRSGR